MLKEFKEFAMRGSVVDLAIGIIIGGAFQKIVSSLVNDVVMPPIGLIVGRVNFSNLFIDLSHRHFETLQEAKAAGVPTINYGIFINNVVDFLVVAFTIFLIVRQINRLTRPEAPPPPSLRVCPFCRSHIAAEATRCPQCTSDLPQ